MMLDLELGNVAGAPGEPLGRRTADFKTELDSRGRPIAMRNRRREISRCVSNDLRISFNGLASVGKACESFIIDRVPVGKSGSNWCKTSGLPYDKLVVASLIALEYFTGTEVGSDGGRKDWSEGLNLVRQFIPEACIPQTI